MLSIGKLGVGQADYYLQAVGQGIEDYYAGTGEAPGRWLGTAATELALAGQVDADQLRAVLNGGRPDGSGPLTRSGPGQEPRARVRSDVLGPQECQPALRPRRRAHLASRARGA